MVDFLHLLAVDTLDTIKALMALALLFPFLGLLLPLHCNWTPNATLAGAVGGAMGTTPRLAGREECRCCCAIVAAAEETSTVILFLS